MQGENWTTLSFSKIKRRKLKWLFPPFLPLGFITTVTGDGGVGKSTCLIDIIARITTGDPMPQIGDETEQTAIKGSALIICKEDDPGLVIKPRLAAAGADMRHVHMVVVQRSRNPDDLEVIDSLDTGTDRLERIIQDIGDVRVILIDPITNFFGKLDFNRDDQVRRLLTPLSRLAAKYEIAILNVVHMNKDTAKKGSGRILGGTGIVNVGRSTLFVAAIAGSSRRLLMMGKENLAGCKKAVAFIMRNVDGQAQIEWGADYEQVDFDEVLAGRRAHFTKQQEAAVILRKSLADGPVRSTDIRELAKELDISFNTFKAAKKEIGVVAKKRDDIWWWELLPRE
jgi:hypothetical protein